MSGQHKVDSAMETVTNTVIGFGLSLAVWQAVAAIYGIPMPISHNLGITGIFTVVSLVRQYVLRRAFNGRTVWQSIRDAWARRFTKHGRYMAARAAHRAAVGIPEHRMKTRNGTERD